MNIMGIIPARGGSKGVPGKNIKSLNGKPLIVYTIEEGKKSRYIDKIIVSTDDEEIQRIGIQNGAESPFMRPKELAGDNSKAIDTYIYTLNEMEKVYNYKADVLVVLQPTSPMRNVKHIDEAIELFLDKNADSVVSMCEVEHSPFWYKVLTEEGKIKDFIDTEDSNANRQQLPKVYRPNGAVYVFKNEIITKHKGYYTDKSYSYIMKSEDSIDIDTMLDFKIADFIMRERTSAKE